MNRTFLVAALGLLVVAASLVLLAGVSSGWLVALAGFVFVGGGTLLTAVVIESYERLISTFRSVPSVFSESIPTLGRDEGLMLSIAEAYRHGRVRRAEMLLKGIVDPFLRRGAQMVIDRCSRDKIERTFAWHISSLKEEKKRRLRIAHDMANVAPAFGMLGTLMGLVRLLFSLGDSGLDAVGAAMGFAMITTAYGLVIANLVVKPIANKMEQQSREQLAWVHMKYELVCMLHDKQHPTMIKDSLTTFAASLPASRVQDKAPVRVGMLEAV